MDKIKVIEQTTSERKQETADLWEQCKPLLYEGKTLPQAVRIIKNLNHHSFVRTAWYRDLLTYAKEHGYNGY